jgi:hypothetical protein
MPINDDNEIRGILSSSRTVAVVGASDKPWRDSNDIMRYLMKEGYRVFAVNPTHTTVLEQPCYANLKDIPEPIDIVDVFRRSDAVPEIVHDAISVKAKTLWLQLGVSNDEGTRFAEEHGMKTIVNRCIAVDHRRLIR